MALTTLVGKLAQSASQERAVVQDERSAVLHWVWDPEEISPDRPPSPRRTETDTFAPLSLETGGWKRLRSAVRTVRLLSRTLLSSLSAGNPQQASRLSEQLGKTLAPGFVPLICQCSVSMQGAQWASGARLRGLETQHQCDIFKSPAKSFKVQGPPQRRCRSGGAMWLRRTPSWTPSSGNSTVKVRI